MYVTARARPAMHGHRQASANLFQYLDGRSEPHRSIEIKYFSLSLKASKLVCKIWKIKEKLQSHLKVD